MWKYIFAIPIFTHGLAHLSGFLASWTSVDTGYTSKPWIFSQGVNLQSWVGRTSGLLWLVAMVGLIGSAFGIVFRHEWWPLIAIVSSGISLVVIVPWWHTIPPGAKVGAIFDILTIATLLSPLQRGLLEIVQ